MLLASASLPTAVKSSPVVFTNNALLPTAVLSEDVLSLKANEPIAVHFSAVSFPAND